ncbi:Secretory carrier-associated membrane protein [Gigaspora margarita]|uniref:Secretory carrier-associated membrane protein n=1 Tax=Gigaspora margarita TaxID=4874 RepID=A0A8H4ETC7_GIGMA|nr:Secretory carrier-associated membrane protein [Gigaspora margarita]
MPEKNWPPCRPVIYHNIQEEIIEPSSRETVEQSYKLWLSILVNGFTGRYAAGSVIVQLIIALIYIAFWPIFDFTARHLTLYRAYKHDNVSYFRWFFFVTFLDIIFGIFIGIGFVFGGGGGLMEMIKNFEAIKEKGAICIVAGVFNAVCATLVFAQVVLHVMLWRKVQAYFESKGWKLLPGDGNSK